MDSDEMALMVGRAARERQDLRREIMCLKIMIEKARDAFTAVADDPLDTEKHEAGFGVMDDFKRHVAELGTATARMSQVEKFLEGIL